MSAATIKIIRTLLILLGGYLAIRYLLPILLPFLIGGALAFTAEPAVNFLSSRLRLPRGVAAGIGVTMTFCALLTFVLLLCGLLVREVRALVGILPDLSGSIRAGMDSLSGWLLNLASGAPPALRGTLTRNVTAFFSDGSALLDRATVFLLDLASGILSHVPDSFLGLGTAIISSFMISAKLPALREFWAAQDAAQKLRPLAATLGRLKVTLGGWLKAQLKLSSVTFLIAMTGFFFLRIPHAPLWALLVALVDAFPILGSGTVLIPWSLVSFLQGSRMQAFGLLGIYAVAALGRSVLEPKFVGRQLGIDPLVTLISLYAGYKLFGFAGMILAPMAAVTITQLLQPKPDN